MANLIAGLIAVLLIIVFLGNYAVTLNSVPLWVIIVVVLMMILIDYVGSLRKGEQESEE